MNILGFKNLHRDFPGMKELAEMFEEAGFKDIHVKPYSGGVAAMHIGYK